MAAVWFLCHCGEPIHRIAAGRYAHDNGSEHCADGAPARSTLDDEVAA